jgi:prepilin signal peptidase PulO-like enzyme (type II secretory pathway)
VELGLAALFLLAWHVVPPALSVWSIAAFISLLVFLSALLALVVYDIRHTLVPMPFIYVLLGASFAAPLFQSLNIQSPEPLYDAFFGGAVLAGFLYALHVVTKGKGMGMGDVYIVGAAGLLLGLFRGIEALMFAVWIGTLFYLGIMLISRLMKIIKSSRFSRVTSASEERGVNLFAWRPSADEAKTSGVITMKTELPFVPFLAVGVLLAIFTDISPLAFGTWLSETLW